MADGINEYVPRGQFVHFHNRKERWAVLVCHRRAGKTVACVSDLIYSALLTKKQDARFAYIAPLFNQAKDVAWTYVKRMSSDIPGINYNESELRADFPNGSRIRLYGADNPDRLRGLYFDGAVCDEFGDMKPRVWGEVVRPLLADRKGWAVFIGTPKGKNEFWDIWNRAQNDPAWFKLRLRASESGLIDAAELADASKGMDENQIQQEFECSFEAAIVGAIYGKEMREAEPRITQVPYDPNLPVHTAWDLGWRDDTSIWWYQVAGNEVHLLEYHASSGNPIEFYADLIKAKPYKYGLHWLPHDARAKTLASGGKSIEEQLASKLGWPALRIVPNLTVQDGIQAARLMFPRVWFDAEHCAEGIECLRQYQREWDDDKKQFRDSPRHDWTSHGADAFRMVAVACRQEPAKMQEKVIDLHKQPTFKDVFWAEVEKVWTRL